MNKNMDSMYDVVIVGGGPAGLTAALYLARACYRVVVLEKERFGGQITITSEVVNFPGVFKTSGKALTDTMRKQAESFGAEFLLDKVTGLELKGDIKTIKTPSRELKAYGVLIATGAHPRKIGFAGEDEFQGRGVAYCATCDGEFFTDKEVFVIGGGFAAAEESVFLTKYAKKVNVILRKDDFSCAKATADEAKNNPKIHMIPNTILEEVSGDSALTRVKYTNIKTGQTTIREAEAGDNFGVFSFAGYVPATDFIKGLIDLDENGYIICDRNLKTGIEGVYAAGDVCVKHLRQVVTATGDGALAATELERYASAMHEKLGIIPKAPERKSVSAVPAVGNEGQKAVENSSADSLFTAEMLAQLNTVFERMEKSLILKVYTDDRQVSKELSAYMTELAELSDKLTVELINEAGEGVPCVKVHDQSGAYTGLAFHGVPGGHEFTSFVLGLYNAAGPGQPMAQEVKDRIGQIVSPVDMKIMVSLTCTMCPDLVVAAQRIAAENSMVRAEIFDLSHFPEMKDKYQVMSVPCMVINGGKPVFGKKDISQLLDLILQ